MTTEEYKKVNPRKSTAQPDHIMLTICGDARYTMCVMWRTSTDSGKGYMLIRRDGEEQTTRVDSLDRITKTDLDTNIYHWAKPQNLTPGTKYFYTVGDDSHRSPEFSFSTQEDNLTKFRFLVITDQQREDPYECPDYSVERDLLTDALNRYPDIRFIFTAGDNSNNGENEIQWNGVFSGLEGFCESIPMMMCVGNHDSRGYGDYFGEDVKKYWPEYADLFNAQFAECYPPTAPEKMQGENYSFDYGNCHFTVLSVNNQDKLGDWLYEDLHSSQKTWKMGAYHFPVYPVMPEGENADGYPYLRKGVEEGRFDVLFSGHEHSFARTYPMTDKGMFDKPSQGTIHYIAGNAGRNVFCTNTRKIWHPKFYPQEERLYLYTIAEVDGNKLTLTAILEDGRTVDILIIDKDSDSVFPPEPAPVFERTKCSFKGVIPDLAMRGQYCEQRNGLWYCPFGSLARSFGGIVNRTPGKIFIDFYGVKAEFTENSNVATLDGQEYTLKNSVYKGQESQLYISVPDIENIFGVNSQYYEHNNMINFDHPSEKKFIERN